MLYATVDPENLREEDQPRLSKARHWIAIGHTFVEISQAEC